MRPNVNAPPVFGFDAELHKPWKMPHSSVISFNFALKPSMCWTIQIGRHPMAIFSGRGSLWRGVQCAALWIRNNQRPSPRDHNATDTGSNEVRSEIVSVAKGRMSNTPFSKERARRTGRVAARAAIN
jgi:hypothetical protein